MILHPRLAAGCTVNLLQFSPPNGLDVSGVLTRNSSGCPAQKKAKTKTTETFSLMLVGQGAEFRAGFTGRQYNKMK